MNKTGDNSNRVARIAAGRCSTVIVLAAALYWTCGAQAQGPGVLHFEVTGTGQEHRLGASVAAVGDLDNDGIPDVAVGAPIGSVDNVRFPGYVRVVSGADGSELLYLEGASDYDKFGEAVAGAGDVDADGVQDIIVGAWGDDPNGLSGAGRAWVFSGFDGSVLYTFDGTAEGAWFGRHVTGMGDVDSDGYDDVGVGSGPSSDLARIAVFSGFDGSVIWSQTRPWGIACVGDVDGDGVNDAISGHRVLSGLDGASLLTLDDHLPARHGNGAGDVNSDGVPDVIMWSEDLVRVRSGADGAQLMLIAREPYGVLSLALRGLGTAGDVNLDGFDDVIVGDRSGGVGEQGQATVYSGIDGRILLRTFGSGGGDWFGISVASVGDLDGDLRPDIVVGAKDGDVGGITNAGYARVILTDPTVPPVPISLETGASAETPINGTVSGSFVDTQANDAVFEAITERESGGKPANRFSFLEHHWTFELPGAETVTFFLSAFHTANGEQDAFAFEWFDGSDWAPLLTEDRIVYEGTYQEVILPDFLSGTITVRVRDTDSTPGNRELDTLFVDHMFILSEGSAIATTAPAAPSNLVASPVGADMMQLNWTDNAGVEDGFHVERSTGGGDWTRIILAGRDFTSLDDGGLETQTTYEYRVRSYNAVDDSAWSNVASATTTVEASGAVHVASIVVDTQRHSAPQYRSWKRGRATVTIVDDAGAPVEGAEVTGTFTGSYSGTYTGTTGPDGIAVLLTSDWMQGNVSIQFCVDDVVDVLNLFPYDPAANVETCDVN